MANISCNELAEELLGCCLRGQRWPHTVLERLIASDCSDALFRIVVERLADLFEPRLCDTYAALFSEVIASALPEMDAEELAARYQRVRRAQRFAGDPARVQTVFVLSRVTLGADVAITSVMLDAAKRRFPNAQVTLVGSRKAWELFAADPRIGHAPVSYLRSGTVRERLAPGAELRKLLARPHSIVIDPDSRLTQLGLLPVCPEEDYFFFESRSYGGDADEPLPVLARRWATETFGVEAAPYIAPQTSLEIGDRPLVTVSLGVGENPAKRIPDPFEEQLLARLVRRGAFLFLDKGAGAEEAGRVERAIARSGVPPERVRAHEGSFAAFASVIARSNLYAGYDSAGQHVAAACGVPLLSVFAGFASPRMFARWRPVGPGPIEVIRVEASEAGAVLDRALHGLDRMARVANLTEVPPPE